MKVNFNSNNQSSYKTKADFNQKNNQTPSFGLFDPNIAFLRKQIGTFPTLSDNEQKAYVKVIEKGREYIETKNPELIKKGEDLINGATKRLVEGNLKFILGVGKHFKNDTMSLPEIINEGVLTFFHGAKGIHSSDSNKPLSYLVYWIRTGMSTAAKEKSLLIRIPAEQQREQALLARMIEKKLPDEEIMKKFGWSSKRLKAQKKLLDEKIQTVSTSTPIGEDGTSLEEVLKSNHSTPDTLSEGSQFKSLIQDLLNDLDPKQKSFINNTYGLIGGETSMKEAGEIIDVHGHSTKIYKKRALNLLRQKLAKKGVNGKNAFNN